MLCTAVQKGVRVPGCLCVIVLGVIPLVVAEYRKLVNFLTSSVALINYCSHSV